MLDYVGGLGGLVDQVDETRDGETAKLALRAKFLTPQDPDFFRSSLHRFAALCGAMQFQHQRFWLKQGAAPGGARAPEPSFEDVKRELKEWEHAFQKEHGRKPSKADLEKLPEIRKKYKLHATLKQKADESAAQATARKRKRDDKTEENSDEEKDANWSVREPLPEVYVSLSLMCADCDLQDRVAKDRRGVW